MRIISGIYKGMAIKMPKSIRPTQNVARKALFDILGGAEGLVFLELFAGSGAVGIEALSWGAEKVFFVEKERPVLNMLRDNLMRIPKEKYEILPFEVQNAVQAFFDKGMRFDVIFLDPPYDKDEAKKVLQTLGGCDILARHGYLIVQHSKKEILPDKENNLFYWRSSSYGGSILTFYRKKEDIS